MSLLDNNLHSLSRHQPQAHASVQKSSIRSSISFEKSRQGSLIPNVEVDGKKIWLHSRFDPIKEAQRFIENHNIKTSVVIVYGFGCGYHIEALLKEAHDATKIFIVEPNVPLFKSMLEHRDFVKIFADTRITLLIGTHPQEIPSIFDKYLMPVFLGTRILTHEASIRVSGKLYREISQAIKDFIDFGTTSLYTAASISTQSRFNMFCNFPHLVFNPGIAQFKDMAKNCAAVVIGAGPSLAKNIHFLKDSPVVKIATGTILKRLLSEGIVPHFVCNIDYHHKLTKKYFQDLPPLPNTILVADSRASYGANDVYPGPVCSWDDSFLINFLGPFRKKPHGTLSPSATVAQSCFNLAKYLGCDPIITVGLDLSYPGHITHMPGTAILDDWFSETNRFVSNEDKEWEYFARIRKALVHVKDYQDKPVYTDRQMFTYIQLFNRLFQQSSQRIIDASEQGAKKEGAEIMPLAEALTQNFNHFSRDSFIDKDLPWSDLTQKDRILEVLDNYLESIGSMESVYKSLIEKLEEIKEDIESPQMNHLIKSLERIQKKLMPYNQINQMVNELIQADDYQRQRRDADITFGGYQGFEFKAKQIDRDLKFSQALSTGLSFFKEFIWQARRRCESWPEKLPKDFLPELRSIKEKIMHDDN